MSCAALAWRLLFIHGSGPASLSNRVLRLAGQVDAAAAVKLWRQAMEPDPAYEALISSTAMR